MTRVGEGQVMFYLTFFVSDFFIFLMLFFLHIISRKYGNCNKGGGWYQLVVYNFLGDVSTFHSVS